MVKDKDRITELENLEKDLAQKIADVESQLAAIDEYTATESKMIELAVNDKFKHVTFKLFETLLNGSIEDCCEAILEGRPYSAMSKGEGIFVGIDIINVLSKHYKMSVPLFIDNSESYSFPIESTSQTIELDMDRGVKEVTYITK